MTLSLAFKAGDGIAVAADSRTSFNQPIGMQSRVLSDSTHKVFQVANVAAATFGYAFLLGRNIAGHMSEYAKTHSDGDPRVSEVATSLTTFFGDLIDHHLATVDEAPIPEGATALGFLLGGYDDGTPRLLEVKFPSREVEELAVGAWRGQTDVVTRLIKGVDIDLLARRCGNAGLGEHQAALQREIEKMEYTIPFQLFNLQDIVDLAVLLIRTTIDVQRLTHGTAGSPISWPGVGGPIEIATVTATAGFRWVQETKVEADRPRGVAVRL